jgi:hypothetical protein
VVAEFQGRAYSVCRGCDNVKVYLWLDPKDCLTVSSYNVRCRACEKIVTFDHHAVPAGYLLAWGS